MRTPPNICSLLLVMGLSTACATEYVELLPDHGPTDQEAETAGDLADPPDARPDQSPDQAPSCVCRIIDCRVANDCQTGIGPTSQCVGTVCTGGKGTCKKDSECGATGYWACTASPTSTSPCPP